MSLIQVPVEELLAVHDRLQHTEDLMASSPIRSLGDRLEALGHRDLQSAGRGFEKRWNDGRHMIDKDLGHVRDASKTVADAFQHADEALTAALDAPAPQQPSPGGFLFGGVDAHEVLDGAVAPLVVAGPGNARTVADQARTSSLPDVAEAGR